ncbi:hypothetical protein ABIA16_001292 [Sinorhizobium fredii]
MAGKGHATGDLADLRGIELGHIDWPSQLCFGFFEDETDDGIGATERLEAAEPQPLSFVLQMNRGNAGFGRESRQGDERRLGMLVAIAEVAVPRPPPRPSRGSWHAPSRAAADNPRCCWG